VAVLSRSAVRVGWILIGCVVATGRAAHAQERRHEYEVKAAYLLNFLNYVEWPAAAPASSRREIHVCMLGGDPFGDVLIPMIRARQVGGRKIETLSIDRPVELDRCDVGFIAADANPAPEVWLEALEGRPVLTVGEQRDFATHGGMIAFILKNQTVRFEVNLAAVRASRLQLSSRLLRLASDIHD